MDLIGLAMSRGLARSNPDRWRIPCVRWHHPPMYCLRNKAKAHFNCGREFREPYAFYKHKKKQGRACASSCRCAPWHHLLFSDIDIHDEIPWERMRYLYHFQYVVMPSCRDKFGLVIIVAITQNKSSFFQVGAKSQMSIDRVLFACMSWDQSVYQAGNSGKFSFSSSGRPLKRCSETGVRMTQPTNWCRIPCSCQPNWK